MVCLIKRPITTKYSTKRIRCDIILLQIGVGLLFVMQDGWTALHYAANRGHVDVLHILVMLEQCNVIVCNKVSSH